MAERARVPSVTTSPAPGNPVLSPLPSPPPFPLPLQASSRPLEQEGAVEGCGQHCRPEPAGPGKPHRAHTHPKSWNDTPSSLIPVPGLNPSLNVACFRLGAAQIFLFPRPTEKPSPPRPELTHRK